MPLGKPPKYYDYDAYVQKFQKKAATTDDTFTPEELYRDLLAYVDQRIFPLDGYKVERPFVPGGDYLSYPYTDRSVVIDNPPFSICGKIREFYLSRGIRYFLFIPIMTARPSRRDCILYGPEIIYQNQACVKTGLRTNLIRDVVVKSDPELFAIIERHNFEAKRLKGAKLTPNARPVYPENVSTVGRLSVFGGMDWELRGEDYAPVKLFREDDGSYYDAYGYPFRVSESWMRERQEEKARQAEITRKRTEFRLVYRDREDYD